MNTHPFLINQDASGHRLNTLEGDKETRYDEAWLQELLRQNPAILPVAEVESVFSPLIPIGREVATETGAIDNMFISPRGYLTIVETKLWRNPEAKREVVAQVIDYASALAKWDYARLDATAKQYTKRYAESAWSLADWIEKQIGGELEGGRGFFEDTVSRNLRLGRFLVLIVGDRIRESVVEMVNYVNKYPGLALNVALIELQGYWVEKGRWPIVAVPRIVARTEIIERSIVEVTVVQGKPAQIEVRRPDQKEPKKQRPLTEEAFWAALKQNAPSECQKIKDLVDAFVDRESIELTPRESSLVIGLRLHDSDVLVSLFHVDTQAQLHVWPSTTIDQIRSAGLDTASAKSYDARMRALLKQRATAKMLHKSLTSVNLQEFSDTVNQLISDLQQSES
jgi:hypothetical protein